jgi:hypothetical protein
MLNSPGTRLEGDAPEEGERFVGKVPRTIHTLFGDGTLFRNGYQKDGGPVRFAADKALGLVRGHTARRAALLARAAARAPYEHAAADVEEYTGLPVSGRSLQRLVRCQNLERLRHGFGNGNRSVIRNPMQCHVHAELNRALKVHSDNVLRIDILFESVKGWRGFGLEALDTTSQAFQFGCDQFSIHV